MNLSLGGFLLAMVVTSVFLPFTRTWLSRRGIVDRPNERSSHTEPTPRGAGVALTIGVAAAWLLAGASGSAAFGFVVIMSVFGFMDDLRSRSVLQRLGAQAILGLAVSWVLVSDHAANLPTVLTLVCITVWLVGSVNVANFMDGINGITAAHGVIIGGTYWILLGEAEDFWPLLAAALVGASAAFLPWNWGRRARAFLGDAGSYLLGAGFGVLAFGVWQSGYGILVAVAPVSIYWVDVMSTLARRVWRGQNPTSAHRDHAYQRLVASGCRHSSVALLVAGFSGVACAIALLDRFEVVQPAAAWVSLVALWLFYLCLPAASRRWPTSSGSLNQS